jgi:hypothetical protein
MPIVTRMSKKIIIFSIAAKAADDNKDNYVLVREKLHAFSVIPTTYEDKSMKDSWHTERELNVDTQDSIKLV